jgi:Na+/melibiose symporter-like transporter
MTHLAIRFLLELAALAATIPVGASVGNPPLGFAGAVFAGVLFVAIWGLWIAPRARYALSTTARLVIGTLVMLAAAAGLVLTGQPTLGLVLIAAIVANAILLVATGAYRETGAAR